MVTATAMAMAFPAASAMAATPRRVPLRQLPALLVLHGADSAADVAGRVGDPALAENARQDRAVGGERVVEVERAVGHPQEKRGDRQAKVVTMSASFLRQIEDRSVLQSYESLMRYVQTRK